ncbi:MULTISPECIES: HBL/NHE enterotoxin family protein [Streptomyces]|uniref:HBL/NHE enterotoxin family protein n=1 Tax=Streptomyces ramulosus TaxID=47762 RepID=A0ABW1FF26_9ACTN
MTTQIEASVELQQSAGNAVVEQGGLAAVVQSYAMSVTRQQKLDPSRCSSQVKPHAIGINKELDSAAETARYYLNTVQPESMRMLNAAHDYFLLQRSLIEISQEVQDKDDLAEILRGIRDDVGRIAAEAQQYVRTMQKLRDDFTNSGKAFTEYAAKLNAVVGGNQGVLRDLSNQLNSVNSQIRSNSSKAPNWLAIVGGLALIALGTLGAVFTGGLSLGLAIGGGVLLVKGMGRNNGQTLARLENQKRDIIAKQQQIQGEVKLLQTCEAGLTDLGGEAAKAATSAQSAANGWTDLRTSLDSFADQVEKSSQASGIMQKFRMQVADSQRDPILDKIQAMQRNLTSPQLVTSPTQPTGDLVQGQLGNI